MASRNFYFLYGCWSRRGRCHLRSSLCALTYSIFWKLICVVVSSPVQELACHVGTARLSRRGAGEFPPREGSEVVFNLVALLATLAIGLTLMSPQGCLARAMAVLARLAREVARGFTGNAGVGFRHDRSKRSAICAEPLRKPAQYNNFRSVDLRFATIRRRSPGKAPDGVAFSRSAEGLIS
jgi:hypothetical protein